MGLLDKFKEANEDAHGARLERGLQDTMSLLASIDEDIRVNALMRFIDKRNKLLSNIRNMTSKGCIDMGMFLQEEARNTEEEFYEAMVKELTNNKNNISDNIKSIVIEVFINHIGKDYSSDTLEYLKKLQNKEVIIRSIK